MKIQNWLGIFIYLLLALCTATVPAGNNNNFRSQNQAAIIKKQYELKHFNSQTLSIRLLFHFHPFLVKYRNLRFHLSSIFWGQISTLNPAFTDSSEQQQRYFIFWVCFLFLSFFFCSVCVCVSVFVLFDQWYNWVCLIGWKTWKNCIFFV
jgi:hypothetical protein